jgi:TusA-related sulfurtransferase
LDRPKTRQETVSEAQYCLDISADGCPLTFVKTKLLLERMAIGEVASIRLSAGEPLDNVPRTLREQGQVVLALEPERGAAGTFQLLVRKAR